MIHSFVHLPDICGSLAVMALHILEKSLTGNTEQTSPYLPIPFRTLSSQLYVSADCSIGDLADEPLKESSLLLSQTFAMDKPIDGQNFRDHGPESVLSHKQEADFVGLPVVDPSPDSITPLKHVLILKIRVQRATYR